MVLLQYFKRIEPNEDEQIECFAQSEWCSITTDAIFDDNNNECSHMVATASLLQNFESLSIFKNIENCLDDKIQNFITMKITRYTVSAYNTFWLDQSITTSYIQ